MIECFQMQEVIKKEEVEQVIPAFKTKIDFTVPRLDLILKIWKTRAESKNGLWNKKQYNQKMK